MLQNPQVAATTPGTWAEWGEFGAYFGLGAIGVLPEEGFVNLCKDVFEDAPGTYTEIGTHYDAAEYTEMMYDVSVMMTYVNNATFNCYFAMREQILASTYENLINDVQLVLNLLFNAGQQYEDIKHLTTYWGDSAGFTAQYAIDYPAGKYLNYTYWEFLGYAIGDCFIRIFYREYYEDLVLDVTDWTPFDYN